MAEYIERETFLKDIEERYCLPCKEAGKDYNGCKCRACWVDDMCGEVIDAPAADVAPVRYGHWNAINQIATGMSWKYRCNDCGCPQEYTHNYCPNCGARMDGGAD